MSAAQEETGQAKETWDEVLVDDIKKLGVDSADPQNDFGGRTGLMVRASDSGPGDPGSILGRVGVFVSLSKRHLLPKSTGNTQE